MIGILKFDKDLKYQGECKGGESNENGCLDYNLYQWNIKFSKLKCDEKAF